uniref:Putative secreted protein n=1 Tax=Panstrongylus lignarius TaxID=156445 RepID=A0A224Y1X1_9HEMI
MANCNRTSSLLLFCSSCSASSLDIAKASCNCNSSSPAVVGRAHIISTLLGVSISLEPHVDLERVVSLPKAEAVCANLSLAFKARALSFLNLSSSLNSNTSCLAFSLTLIP